MQNVKSRRRWWSAEILAGKNRAVIPFFFILFIVLFFLIGCSPRDRVAGFLYLRLNANPTTLDPALIVDVTGGTLAAKLFNGLVRLDEQLNVVPDIAERWEVRDGGTAYIFHLKKGVCFSNGREVTSADFNYSFKRVFMPETKSPDTWVLERILGAKEYLKGTAKDISGIKTIDRYTLLIRLEKPFSPFLKLLTMPAAYVVPQEEVQKWGSDFSTHPVGTGPFVLKEWNHNSVLALTRNEGYFDKKAKVAGIVYRIIPEDLTAVTEFEVGNLDVIGVPASEYGKYRNSRKWSPLISSAEGLNTYYLGFNCSRPPFDDINLRRAVSFAVDRGKILKTFYEGRGRLAKGAVPDLLRKWSAPGVSAYDPDTAKRIIAAGRLKGKVINFYVSADQEVVDIAEVIQYYLNRAGLDVRIKQFEWSAYKSALNKGEADMFWIGWWADYPDPENFLFPLFHSSNHGAGGNRTRYTNREVDRLIEAGQGAADPWAADRYYMAAEKIVTYECPSVFFWHRTDFTLRQPWVRRYKIYPIYSMDKGVEVSF
jgi:ABC-type transport system substrate-binding protein